MYTKGPLLALVLLVACYCQFASAQTPNTTVTVTGSGATIDEAKSDAIRQALQLTMKQLVVVDRAVSSNAVLHDRLMSTMNGYIERFESENIQKTTKGYQFKANVTVSASRIENFIGVIGGGGEMQGSTLLAEQNRRLAQIQADKLRAQAFGEIFDRTWRGFPSQSANVDVIRLRLSPKDPNVLILDLQFSYKAEFIKSIESTLKTLALRTCISGKRRSDVSNDLAAYAQSAAYESVCNGTANAGLFGLSPKEGDVPRDAMCLGYADRVQCYQLPSGTYCASCDLANFSFQGMSGSIGFQKKGLLTFGRFIDENGRSANVGDVCRTTTYNAEINVFLENASSEPSRRRLLGGIDFAPKLLNMSVPTSSVSLGALKYFAVVPALLADAGQVSQNVNESRWVSSLVPNFDRTTRAGCELLEDAVRLQLMGRQIPQSPQTSMSTSDSDRTLVETAKKEPRRVLVSTRVTYWSTVVGSTLMLEEDSDFRVKITYASVGAPNAEQNGVRKGAIIFEGKREANQLIGKAVLFARNDCRINYPMTAVLQNGGNIIVTSANAPLVDADCNIVGSRQASFTWSKIE